MITNNLLAGIYRHYKGQLYLPLGYGHDANADSLWRPYDGEARGPIGEREVVVYVGLELDDAQPGPRLAVRDVEDFEAFVCPDANCERYGKTHAPDGQPQHWSCHMCGSGLRPRFSYVGPSYSPGMRSFS